MEYLKRLCEDLEISVVPEKDSTGAYPFSLNDSLTILIREEDPTIFFEGIIAPCPKEKREDLFILLMKANLFSQGTMGSAIGLSQDEKDLTLSRSMPYEVDYRAFRETLEDFANMIDYWREQIQEHQTLAQDGIL